MKGIDKKALFNFSYGVYIVSTRTGDKMNGQIANAAMQISSSPITIAVSLNKKNLTHDMVAESKKFGVSVVAEDAPLPFIGKFGFKSGRDIEKFEGVEYVTGDPDVPVVKQHCLSAVTAKVIGSIDVSTHTIFVGEVLEGELFSNAKPLSYEDYHIAKNGKSPETAPTYIFNEIAGFRNK